MDIVSENSKMANAISTDDRSIETRREKFNQLRNEFDALREGSDKPADGSMKITVVDIDLNEFNGRNGPYKAIAITYDRQFQHRPGSARELKKSAIWTDEARYIFDSLEIGNQYLVTQGRDERNFVIWEEIELLQEAESDSDPN